VKHERRTVLLFLAALAAAGAGACSSSPAEEPASEVSESENEAPAVNVSVRTIHTSQLKDQRELAGRLEPWVEVRVSTELGGTVQEVGFEKGQTVAKGRILARIGTDLFEASLAEAEAELVAAEANYNKSKELFDRQAVPRQDLVSSTSTFKRAEARLEQAKIRVERSILRAPVSGVAIDREIELGEVVAPGSLVTVIHEVSKLKASVGVPEDDIAFFRVGGEAKMTVDAFPDRAFMGKIHFLGSAATGQNRTFPAEIAIDNRASELRPGMIVRVSLVRRVYDDAMVVPRDAVLERDAGNVVFVLNGDRAELRNVKTGPSESGSIVVLDGLTAGDQLIVSGHRNLIDGQKVRAVTTSDGDAKQEKK
jgi:membrane fusion protein, multidrug efflux system